MKGDLPQNNYRPNEGVILSRTTIRPSFACGMVPILCNFIQFSGYTSHTPCAAMNFGLGHGSRCPVPNVKCVTLGPNLPWRHKKGRIFEILCLECQIFRGVTPKFVGCRSAELVFCTGRNPCRIEWNHPVFGNLFDTHTLCTPFHVWLLAAIKNSSSLCRQLPAVMAEFYLSLNHNISIAGTDSWHTFLFPSIPWNLGRSQYHDWVIC
jgi:hypothetical protein